MPGGSVSGCGTLAGGVAAGTTGESCGGITGRGSGLVAIPATRFNRAGELDSVVPGVPWDESWVQWVAAGMGTPGVPCMAAASVFGTAVVPAAALTGPLPPPAPPGTNRPGDSRLSVMV